jgi:hypothetical protein
MYNGSITANAVTPSVNMKNRIINGAMVIDQRNAGASITPTNGQFSVDRFQQLASQSSKYTAQQSTTAPTGFTNSLLITSSSAYSVTSSDYFAVRHIIEGYNVADLDWGTANAKTVTLSFWVRSSLTGTFGGALTNDDNTRSYPYTYTISAANTWEYKSVTIAGDTTGTWLKNSGRGIQVRFGFGVGSTQSGTAGAWASSDFISATGATSVVGTNGATFYITGVQLEVGSTATSFDYRPYTTELQLAQRYYFKIEDTNAYFAGKQQGSTECYFTVQAPVSMRATPTPTMGAGNKLAFTQGGVVISSSTTVTLLAISNNYIYMALSLGGFSGLSDNHVGNFRFDATLQFSSEL